jgi:predicted esterase
MTTGQKMNYNQMMANTLTYQEDYEALKKAYSLDQAHIESTGSSIRIINLPFISQSELIFPADKVYYAPKLSGSLLNLDTIFFEGDMDRILQHSDDQILDNKSFNYPLILPKNKVAAEGVIFLFHGLNEKDWTKYLPWAKRLCDLSQKAVILFPLAFHINRAMPEWYDTRAMNRISQKRKSLFLTIQDTSFTNAAMSTRLHFAPSRFFLSGLETYSDIIQLTKKIKSGGIPEILPNAKIDFFGYSAGAFLAQILLMANRESLFEQTKAVLFCGGPLLSRMHLTSRYIMDSEAHHAIRDFYIDSFDRNLLLDHKLGELYENARIGGAYFRSMLSESYGTANLQRQKRLEELDKQILTFALAQDDVMTPTEIQASMIGTKGKPVLPMEVLDFDYPHSHVNPFPTVPKYADAVEKAFDKMMQKAVEFFEK